MESLVEPIRVAISLMGLVTAIAAWKLLGRGEPSRPLAAAAGWLIVASALGLGVSHVARILPAPMLIPGVAAVGLVFCMTAVLSPEGTARFAALDDRGWRLLMSTRAVFGSLILAAGAVGLFPLSFALPAGIGDIVVAALALAAPGSLAAGGSRIARLVVFGLGLADFANVVRLQIVVLVPWFAETNSIGISLLLPWVVVPLLVSVNFAGLRLLLTERTRAAVTT